MFFLLDPVGSNVSQGYRSQPVQCPADKTFWDACSETQIESLSPFGRIGVLAGYFQASNQMPLRHLELSLFFIRQNCKFAISFVTQKWAQTQFHGDHSTRAKEKQTKWTRDATVTGPAVSHVHPLSHSHFSLIQDQGSCVSAVFLAHLQDFFLTTSTGCTHPYSIM